MLGLPVLLAGWSYSAEFSARQIAEKAREKDRLNFSEYGSAPCRFVEIKEDLDHEGVVTDREENRVELAFSSVPIPGGMETRRISPGDTTGQTEEDRSVLDHVDLFDWKMEGEDESHGEPCYRLAFIPRKGVKVQGPRLKVLSQSRGRCWVAKNDFSRIRLEGRLARPLELMGVFVTVREVDFVSTTRRVGRGVAAPFRVAYRFRVEVFPFLEFHERHTQRFDFLAGTASWASAGN